MKGKPLPFAEIKLPRLPLAKSRQIFYKNFSVFEQENLTLSRDATHALLKSSLVFNSRWPKHCKGDYSVLFMMTSQGLQSEVWW